MTLGNNPFSSKDSVVNDIANIMANNRKNAEKISDNITNAAKNAGTEARNSGARTIETRNKIYSKHLTAAAGDTPVSSTSRQEFERIADREWHSTPPE